MADVLATAKKWKPSTLFLVVGGTTLGIITIGSLVAKFASGFSNLKDTMVYSGAQIPDYSALISGYASSGVVTSVAPQVFRLPGPSAALVNNSSTFPYNDGGNLARFAHTYGIRLVPLVADGSGLSSAYNDTGIIAALNSPVPFADSLVALCNANGYDGIQLDWEIDMTNPDISWLTPAAMTQSLSIISDRFHSQAPGRELSVTSYPDNFLSRPYDPSGICATSLDYMSDQCYEATFSTFVAHAQYCTSKCGRVQIGLGDYPNAGPAIAGQTLDWCINNNIKRVSVWPSGGGVLSHAPNNWGYVDTIYGTTDYYGWFSRFLASGAGKVPPGTV